MITDPLEEWRRLREHYGRLGEEELKSLLEESSQLSDIAKETLRAEISSRSLRVQVRDTPPSDGFPQRLRNSVLLRPGQPRERGRSSAGLGDGVDLKVWPAC